MLPAPLGGRQGCFGALGDHLPLMLSNSGQDMHRELVGVGIIYGHELDPISVQAMASRAARSRVSGFVLWHEREVPRRPAKVG
jgi:hypothetical protein